MEYVNLGGTGLRVSRVCLGMMSYGRYEGRPWALGREEAEPIIRAAVEGGITFFDTADVYNGGESEVLTGRHASEAVRDARGVRRRDQGAWRRCRVRTIAASRASTSWPRSTPRYAASGSTTSTCTRSTAGIPSTPIEETIEALDDVVRAGKARYIGASSMYAWQFAKALYGSRQTAGGSSRCRTTTTWSIAKKSAR